MMYKLIRLSLMLPAAFLTLLFFGCEEAVTYPSYLLPLEEVHFQQGVYPSAAYGGTKDTYISSIDPDSNFGAEAIISVGYVDNDSRDDRSLLEFDLKEYRFPVGLQVQSAYLYILMKVKTRDSDTRHQFAAYDIDEEWYSGTGTVSSPVYSFATWNNAKGSTPWSQPGGSYIESSRSSIYRTQIENQWVSIKLNSAMVQRWIENGASNNGVIIKKITDDTATDITHFYSSEESNTELRPRLSIYYTIR